MKKPVLMNSKIFRFGLMQFLRVTKLLDSRVEKGLMYDWAFFFPLLLAAALVIGTLIKAAALRKAVDGPYPESGHLLGKIRCDTN